MFCAHQSCIDALVREAGRAHDRISEKPKVWLRRFGSPNICAELLFEIWRQCYFTEKEWAMLQDPTINFFTKRCMIIQRLWDLGCDKPNEGTCKRCALLLQLLSDGEMLLFQQHPEQLKVCVASFRDEFKRITRGATMKGHAVPRELPNSPADCQLLYPALFADVYNDESGQPVTCKVDAHMLVQFEQNVRSRSGFTWKPIGGRTMKEPPVPDVTGMLTATTGLDRMGQMVMKGFEVMHQRQQEMMMQFMSSVHGGGDGRRSSDERWRRNASSSESLDSGMGRITDIMGHGLHMPPPQQQGLPALEDGPHNASSEDRLCKPPSMEDLSGGGTQTSPAEASAATKAMNLRALLAERDTEKQKKAAVAKARAAMSAKDAASASAAEEVAQAKARDAMSASADAASASAAEAVAQIGKKVKKTGKKPKKAASASAAEEVPSVSKKLKKTKKRTKKESSLAALRALDCSSELPPTGKSEGGSAVEGKAGAAGLVPCKKKRGSKELAAVEGESGVVAALPPKKSTKKAGAAGDPPKKPEELNEIMETMAVSLSFTRLEITAKTPSRARLCCLSMKIDKSKHKSAKKFVKELQVMVDAGTCRKSDVLELRREWVAADKL